jgi:hypothetical protein
MFFLFPETTYYRNNIAADSQDNSEIKEPVTETTAEVAAARKIPYVQQLKPWSPINPHDSYISLFLRPWPLVIYPAVIFSSLIFSTTLAWIVCVVNTNGVVFQGPLYKMSQGISSLINVPAIIGIMLGSYVGGALTDTIAKMWAKKNNGIFEPEFRLIALVFPFFIVPTGLLMYIYLNPD